MIIEIAFAANPLPLSLAVVQDETVHIERSDFLRRNLADQFVTFDKLFPNQSFYSSRSTRLRMLPRAFRGFSEPLLRPQCFPKTPSSIPRSFSQHSPIQLRLASGTARPVQKKGGRRWKGLVIAGAIGSGIFLYDRYEGEEALRRSFRTVSRLSRYSLLAIADAQVYFIFSSCSD